MKDFKLPDLGEGVHEGQIVKVMITPGMVIREDQPLMEVETDKAAVVIPSPFAGVVEKVHVRDGQLVHVGDVMVSFGDSGAGGARGPATSVAQHATNARASADARQPATTDAAIASSTRALGALRKPASPAVRKLARSLGIDIETITGTGPGGRVQRADLELRSRAPAGSAPLAGVRQGSGVSAGRSTSVQDWRVAPAAPLPSPRPSGGAEGRGRSAPPIAAARVPAASLPDSGMIEPPAGEDSADQYGPIRRSALSQARKTIAGVMAQSWSTIPHATDFDDADVTELEQLRKGYTSPEYPQRKLTMLAFIVRAAARALQRFPEFNASIDVESNHVIYKRYINIAIGVHTDRGLVPLVVRDADHLTIPQISDELAVLGEKARTATFAVNDTRGGTYTISNAGAMGGSRYSTPIITPPQVAVLAIGRSRWMPWVIEGEPNAIAPRLIMPLSHSIDHRLLDGGQEVQFMLHIIGDLQNPARLLL